MVQARPFIIGNPGWVRSSARIWVLSSTDNTTAWSGGLNVEADDLFELGSKLRVVGQLEATYEMRPQPTSTPYPLHRTDTDRAALAMAEPVQWLAAGGGPASVMAPHVGHLRTQWGDAPWSRLFAPIPAVPWSRNRSCQRQITVWALPSLA
jgi:hypothetical protein